VLALSMAGLKDSMKGEKPQSKGEILREFWEEVIGSVSKEMGYMDPGAS
jgi:hypothetical protein